MERWKLGKLPTYWVLEDNPLEDIKHIRNLSKVIFGGRVVDVDLLPAHPVFRNKGREWEADCLDILLEVLLLF